MAILKNGKFWAGVAVGAIIGPVVLQKIAPGIKAKLPAQ